MIWTQTWAYIYLVTELFSKDECQVSRQVMALHWILRQSQMKCVASLPAAWYIDVERDWNTDLAVDHLEYVMSLCSLELSQLKIEQFECFPTQPGDDKYCGYISASRGDIPPYFECDFEDNGLKTAHLLKTVSKSKKILEVSNGLVGALSACPNDQESLERVCFRTLMSMK